LFVVCTLWISSRLFTSGSPTVPDGNLTVEAARAEQRGAEDLRPVRGSDHDDAAEPVHLGEKLVQHLLPLCTA
jgi:hypothetical protein